MNAISITAAQLNVKIAAQGVAETQAALGGVSEATSGAMGAASKLALIGGAAIVGFGVMSIKMAGDFQEGMTTLVTGAGESQKNLGMVSRGILGLAVATGETTQQLTNGMFIIESAGYRGAIGLNVLKIAAQGAKTGNADLGATANALTTVLSAYPNVSNGAAGAMNTLTAIVANGKTHMQDLATSISTVLPTAANFGVSLNDVAGALATMTMQNGDAATSTTYLRQLISSLATETPAGSKALTAIGLSAQSVSDEMKKSLPDTLKMITDAIGKTFPAGSVKASDAFKAIMGGSKQMQGSLLLSGSHLAAFNANVAAVALSVVTGGHAVTGFANVQGDMNFKLSQAKEVAETLMISIGTKLIPVVTNLAGIFVNNIAPALSNAVNLISTNRDAFTIFAGIVGTVLVGALVAASIAAWTFVAPMLIAAAPVLAVVAAIGAMVIAFKLAYDHFLIVRIAVAALKVGFEELIGGIKNIADHVGIMANIVGTGMHAILGFISGDSKAASIAAAQHADEMKVKVINTFMEKQIQVVAIEKDQRTKLLEQIAATTDPAKKHALEMKLGVLNHLIQLHDQAIKSAEDQRAKIINHMKLLADEAKHHADLMKMGVIGHFIEMKEQAVQWVQNMLPAVMAKLIDLKNQAITKAQELVVGFIRWLVNLHNQAETEAGNIVTGIMNEINSLPGKLLSAGANMIQALINGISSKIGDVKNVVGNVVGAIGNFFPHSPAKEGALTDLPNWGPRIVDTLATGLVSGAAKVRAATRQLTGGIASPGGIVGSPIAVSNASTYSNGATPDQGVIQNVIMIDGRAFAEVMTRYQAGYLRNSTGQVYG